METQFPAAEFDDWAPGYDQDAASDRGFPFEGYASVLRTIVQSAALRPGDKVLDLGIGTGNLALLFAEMGCRVWGTDFSVEMLKIARVKIPSAILALSDVRADLPAYFPQQFQHIVSAYTFHHFPLAEKVELVQRLMNEHLALGGTLVIGDIAFSDAHAEEILQHSLGSDWEQEYYWLADETLAAFSSASITATFSPLSSCAGVFVFRNQGV